MSSPGYNTRKGNNLPGQWSSYPSSAQRRKLRRTFRKLARDGYMGKPYDGPKDCQKEARNG